MKVRLIEQQDIEPCLKIYNYYIRETNTTLEFDELNPDEFSNRVASITSLFPFLVLEDENTIIGYAYLSYFNERKGYQHTLDVSIYLHPQKTGMHYGDLLMNELILYAKKLEVSNLISIITDENTPSLRFHLKMGFKKVAHFRNIAEKFNHSLGVIYMQKKI